MHYIQQHLGFVQGAQLYFCCLVAVPTLTPDYGTFQPETTDVGHTIVTWVYTSFASNAPPPYLSSYPPGNVL